MPKTQLLHYGIHVSQTHHTGNWIVRIFTLLVLGILLMGKKLRWMLVNLQKLGDETVANPPWYYIKIHCKDMYTGAVEYLGGPFCIAVDIRLMMLLPIAVIVLGSALWLLYDKRSARRSQDKS